MSEETKNNNDGDIFTFTDANWPPKRHDTTIVPCFGGKGVDTIRIDNLQIYQDDFVQIIKDYMTKVPISIFDNRLRLIAWFKSIENYSPKDNPFNDYFKGTAFDKKLGRKRSAGHD
jgi:hypothetical protein